MEAHRIRKAKSLYVPVKDHIFLEVEKNRWLEIESLDRLNYDSIQAFLESEKKRDCEWWGSATRIFNGGPSRIGVIQGS